MRENGCPVCDMDTSDTEFTVEHLGTLYRFCSRQCLDNFVARPTLYTGRTARKHGEKELLKKRTFMLDEILPDADQRTLETAISAMMGIREIEISGNRVSVTYDLCEATARQVEQGLEQAGARLGSGWATRLKRGWVHYIEENELNNLAAGEGPCCNKPPRA